MKKEYYLLLIFVLDYADILGRRQGKISKYIFTCKCHICNVIVVYNTKIDGNISSFVLKDLNVYILSKILAPKIYFEFYT